MFKKDKVYWLKMELDKTDVKILKQLTEDGRKSLRTIAKELKVSTVTVANHLKKLNSKSITLEKITKKLMKIHEMS